MALDQSPKLVSNKFSGAAAPDAKRARIDARTVGYPADEDDQKISWMGMSPAPGKGDGWYVLLVEEEPNKYLVQVNKDERIVEVVRVLGKGEDGPLTFEKAVEHLAVWEYSRMANGAVPHDKQDRDDLGKHYYKNLLLKRGYLVDTTGTLAAVGDIYPGQAGKFLKSDLEALERYQDGLRGENILGELIASHDAIFISETTLEEDLRSFGEIAIFDKMQLFTDTLVKYAGVKLKQVQDFYADPTAKGGDELAVALAKSGHFTQEMVDRFNAAREELFGAVFRFFHVDEADWGKELDLKSKELRKGLLIDPDAQQTYNYFDRKIGYPLTPDDVNAMLFVSARSLVYFRETLTDSPQKDMLERKGIYKQGDIDDLLNYLDLLDIKFQYKALAEAAVSLPGTKRDRELQEKKDAFILRVQGFKEGLKESQDYSPAMEKQIDAFIRASTPIYLIDRIEALPAKIAGAQKYIRDRLLPKPAPAPTAPTPKQPTL
ncbi:MAG TPA: hypothetical protein VEF76_09010 [Patescibacteria group bacterium]|nr:hypothetical protein [Patescibacteria group bacterium]